MDEAGRGRSYFFHVNAFHYLCLGAFMISLYHMHIYLHARVCACVTWWLIGMLTVSSSPVVLGGIGSICHLCRDSACCRFNP